ncbi:MAG: hypothetical protein M1483_03110 [Actinobacteria bacterium]|nr:hypothetical protein [Actinomycetota bacterium]MCL6104614.1 hypothetical protein [Actinomycetota bacterium]
MANKSLSRDRWNQLGWDFKVIPIGTYPNLDNVSVDEMPDPKGSVSTRQAILYHPRNSILILGHNSAIALVNRTRAADLHVDVVRRATGGGAVLVSPNTLLWIDFWIPIGDPLWRSDVMEAFSWLSELWMCVLDQAGVYKVQVHRGKPVKTAWSDSICFAGISWGEIKVAERKAVGISARRTKAGALFQCGALWLLEAEKLLDLLYVDKDICSDRFPSGCACSDGSLLENFCQPLCQVANLCFNGANTLSGLESILLRNLDIVDTALCWD